MNLLHLFVLTLLAASFSAARPSLKALLAKIPSQTSPGISIEQKQAANLTFDCAICGIAINEIEGLLLENRTQQDVENLLKSGLCDLFPSELKAVCLTVANTLPDIFKMLDQQYTVSRVCFELGHCPPFADHVDPSPVPTYKINLDLEPEERYNEVCSIPAFQKNVQFLVDTVHHLLGDAATAIADIGDAINYFYLPEEYAAELRGCASKLGVSPGWLTLFNMGYELSDACTSIVAQGEDGTIYHARNMDFWAGMGFTDTLKDITYEAHYQRAGKTIFKTTTFAGYVGALSGQKPGEFSVSVNTRFYPGGISQLFYEVVAAIEEKNASLVTMLTRSVLQNEQDFPTALTQLQGDTLIADVYYTVAGKGPGQGVVLSRNRKNATDVWTLDAPDRWFLLETNYDHWQPAPWYDDRRDPGNEHMNTLGRKGLSTEAMMKILEQKPTLNLQTTFSMMSVPKTSEYSSTTRWCPYPCTQ